LRDKHHWYEEIEWVDLTMTSLPLLSVMTDNYSTPPSVGGEPEVGMSADRSACRLDSRATDALQVVDVLTGAVAFEHRQKAGLAGTKSAKAGIARHLRSAY
jgi:hypothetical protein